MLEQSTLITDDSPPTDEELDLAQKSWFQWLRESMRDEEEKWRSQGLAWTWIDKAPGYLSPVDWDMDILPSPQREMTRTFRLSLLGGGQITVIEKFERFRHNMPAVSDDIWCHRTGLRVTAQIAEGLRRVSGHLKGVFGEMSAHAAVFPKGTPQVLADRVAATFRLLASGDAVEHYVNPPDRDRFLALLDRGLACSFCQRPLRDHVSTLLGYGPDCARQARLPHNLEAANRLLRMRAELLGP